jgi:flagellar biogenesis protein FliO
MKHNRTASIVGVAVCCILLFCSLGMTNEQETAIRSATKPLQSTPSIIILAASGEKSAFASIANVTSATKALDPLVAAIRKGMDGDEGEMTAEIAQTELFTTTDGVSMTTQLGRMFMSLAFVISIVLALAWFAKKYVVKNSTLGGGHITYISSFALSPKSKLHLVQIGSETLLIGEGNNQLNLISKVDPASVSQAQLSANEADSYREEATGPSFQSKLAGWQNTLNNNDVQEEVRNSLLILGGLSKRLAKKGANNV